MSPVRVAAGIEAEAWVLPGPVLLSSASPTGADHVSLPRTQTEHRRRWPEPKRISAQTLISLTAAVNLSGRGGAGFPFSRKLSTAHESGRRRVVVVNAAEGEPGSAKDSALLLTTPHLVLDGAETVARALHTRQVHVIVPGERHAVRGAVEQAIAERDGGIRYQVSQTSGGFVGGQARAVLELISGRPNLPVTSWAPEAVSGLRGRPTLLSNAETFAQVAVLCALGESGYRVQGTAEQPGTTLLTVGGDGPTPVVIEVPFGIPLAQALSTCGYPSAIPVLMGGYHGVWLSAEQVREVRLSRSELARMEATIGAGVILPVDANSCPVQLTATVVDYLADSSAGRCGPCRNGLPALAQACTVLAQGRTGSLYRIEELTGLLPGRGACAHPDGTVRLVRSMLRAFPDEVAQHLAGRCGHQPEPVGVAADPITQALPRRRDVR